MGFYFRRGTSKVAFVPTIADTDAPTTAEISGGTDLTGRIAEISGFQFSNNPIPTPTLSSTFTTTIPGEDTAEGPQTNLYDDDGGSDAVRTALAKGTTGFIVLMPYGDTTTKRCEVWAVVSTGVNDEWTMGNDPARFMVAFAVTAPPVQDATIS